MVLNKIRFAVLVALATLLVACSKDTSNLPSVGKTDVQANSEVKTVGTKTAKFAYMAPASKRLVLLEDSLKIYVEEHQMGSQMQYLYNFADLNGDGSNEVIVSLRVAGQETGQMRLIYTSDYQTLIGELFGSGPIIVTTAKSDDWSILAQYADKGQYMTAAYQKNAYKWLGMSKENVIEFTEISGTAYLSDEELFDGFSIM